MALRRFEPLAFGLLVLVVNVFICFPTFFTESIGHWQSMHGEWMALARLAGFDWFAPHWWPYWGGGTPLEFTYAPLVPFSLAALARGLGISYPMAFHLLAGLVLVAAPLTLYFAAWRISGMARPALLVALLYSLLSLSEVLVPDYLGVLSARRHYLVLDWDDLPHICSLALLPVASWALHRSRWVVAVLCLASMMLANMFGAVMAALLVLSLARSVRVLVAGVCAYLLICPWLTPSLLLTIRANSVASGEGLWFPSSTVAVAIVVVCTALAWWRGPRILVLSTPVLLIPLLHQWGGGMHFVPQPGRYKLEMEMALACLLGFGLYRLLRYRVLAVVLTVLFALLFARQVVSHRQLVEQQTRPLDGDPPRVARWLEANAPHEFVFMAASLGHWLNTYTEVEHLAGQPYTTAPNWIQQIALYTFYVAENAGPRDAEYSLLWLKAFGLQLVGIPGPASSEYWKRTRNPEKFEGILPVLWRDRGNTIYRVLPPEASRAHVLARQDLVRNKPIHGLDVTEVRPFVAALKQARPAEIVWHGRDRATVRANVGGGQVIHVQMTYHPGWKASGGTLLRPDGLGLMVLEVPGCSGLCEVELRYAATFEQWASRGIAGLTGLGLLLFGCGFWPFSGFCETKPLRR